MHGISRFLIEACASRGLNSPREVADARDAKRVGEKVVTTQQWTALDYHDDMAKPFQEQEIAEYKRVLESLLGDLADEIIVAKGPRLSPYALQCLCITEKPESADHLNQRISTPGAMRDMLESELEARDLVEEEQGQRWWRGYVCLAGPTRILDVRATPCDQKGAAMLSYFLNEEKLEMLQGAAKYQSKCFEAGGLYGQDGCLIEGADREKILRQLDLDFPAGDPYSFIS